MTWNRDYGVDKDDGQTVPFQWWLYPSSDRAWLGSYPPIQVALEDYLRKWPQAYQFLQGRGAQDDESWRLETCVAVQMVRAEEDILLLILGVL